MVCRPGDETRFRADRDIILVDWSLVHDRDAD